MYEREYNTEPEGGEIPSPYVGDFNPQLGEATTLLQQTDPQPVILEIENVLRGNEYDTDKDAWVHKYEPIMNDLGISKVMINMRGVVNTNCILSNLSKRDVNTIVLTIADSIALDICANYREYGLAKSDFDKLIELCSHMCYFSLRRSYMEGERRFLKTTFRSHETNIQRPAQNERSSWNRWWGAKAAKARQ